MSAEEWKQAQKQLEMAQKQLDEARAQAKSEISFSEAIAVDMQDSSADTADGGAVVAGAVGGTASETPSYWRVTTGEAWIIRKRSPAKRSLRAASRCTILRRYRITT